jgi:hypothetical protein
MDDHENRRVRAGSSAVSARERNHLQAGSSGLRKLVNDASRHGLSHEEARAVAELMQTIRRLLPDEDL